MPGDRGIRDSKRADVAGRAPTSRAHRARRTEPRRRGPWRLGSVGVGPAGRPARLGRCCSWSALAPRRDHLGLHVPQPAPRRARRRARRSWRCRPGSPRSPRSRRCCVAGWIAVRDRACAALFASARCSTRRAFLSWAVVESAALIMASRVLTGFAFAERHRRRRPDHRDAPPGGAPGDRPGALPDDRLRHRRDHRQRGRRAPLQHGGPCRGLRPRGGPASPPRSADGWSCRAGRASARRRPCDNPERGTALDRPGR